MIKLAFLVAACAMMVVAIISVAVRNPLIAIVLAIATLLFIAAF